MDTIISMEEISCIVIAMKNVYCYLNDFSIINDITDEICNSIQYVKMKIFI